MTLLLAIGVGLLGYSRCLPAAHVHADVAVLSDIRVGGESIKIKDPWGRIDSEVYVQAVALPPMQCVVLIQRVGNDRAAAVSCR